MKYGLLYYNETDNIGDDVQAYAQKQFLPRVDYLVDREHLGMFVPNSKEHVAVIMSAWYIHNKAAWPPSPYIKPLLTSMHFSVNKRLNGGDDYIEGIGAEYLKKYGPVGCRDYETVKRLNEKGISTYFSSCITLTIKPFDGITKQDYICCVDVDEDIINKLKSSTNREIKIIKQRKDPKQIGNVSFDERMNRVEELLKEYQQAHVVITSRLHTMLPCIALGTPVVFIHEEYYEKDRIDSFLKYAACSFVDKQFLKEDIRDVIENPKENNKEYLIIAENLRKICSSFIKESQEVNEKDNDLPDIDEYKKKLVEKEYYYNLYEKSWRQNLLNIQEMDGYYKRLEELYKVNEALQNEIKMEKEKYEELNNEYKELNNVLEGIYNSRTYKICQRIERILKKKK